MNKKLLLTAPKKMAGKCEYKQVGFNKHCAGRKFSASNPPLLLATNR